MSNGTSVMSLTSSHLIFAFLRLKCAIFTFLYILLFH